MSRSFTLGLSDRETRKLKEVSWDHFIILTTTFLELNDSQGFTSSSPMWAGKDHTRGLSQKVGFSMCMTDIQKGWAAFRNSTFHFFIVKKMQFWIIIIPYELVSNSAKVVPALPCLGERSPHSPALGQVLPIQHTLGNVAETCSFSVI